MLLSDSHIHTMFSSDSEENPVNVVNNAISLGFKHICFTDHNDFDAPLEDGKVMFDLDFPEYIKYFQNLKESYNDKINIHIGVEQGLMRSVADRVNAYDSEKQLDFIIGSSHLVYGEDPYYPEFWEKRSAKDTVLTYYESILDNLGCCHNFDVYGAGPGTPSVGCKAAFHRPLSANDSCHIDNYSCQYQDSIDKESCQEEK